MENPAWTLPVLLGTAWLLPLVSFWLIVFFGPWMGRAGRYAGHTATGAIVLSAVLSWVALLGVWLGAHPPAPVPHAAEHGAHAASQPADDVAGPLVRLVSDVDEAAPAEHADAPPKYYAGDWYTLGQFGSLKITIGYYIDSLTLVMFCMVTLIASCIHFYSMGYMHEEVHDVTDHEITLSDGEHLTRRGRYHRFFQYLSLFCFSMLGLVIAGNVAMVFVFWELVGICSYFLIGFYFERKSASNAANKAFIVNRVGDFGMIIGLLVLWSCLGTFTFGDLQDANGHVQVGAHGEPAEPGLFSIVRPAATGHKLRVPDGMVHASAREEIGEIVRDHLGQPDGEQAAELEIAARTPGWRAEGYGYWLLVIAGLGIFAGCVGKSAQFPLHVWLPDAMEGPTPVSALIHAATMVAAGVYLVGRFYAVFAPEVLLTIAYVGCATLFIAATIAITATDIKRVLAYSTVSQLGYMMLALGVGGWFAGLFHLFTHAFFKALLFLCSGSVIHGVHTNEMTEMGGLRHKMPWTAYTMLVGCLAISGFGIPFVIGLSGYYSKDAILAQSLSFMSGNEVHSILFFAAAAGAAITAFYMFRLWYMTFAGEPRDKHRYEHAHESPGVMVYPLVILAVFAGAVAWKLPWTDVNLTTLLEQSRPVGTLAGFETGGLVPQLSVPGEHLSHAEDVHSTATWVAFSTAMAGFLLATVLYCWKLLDPDEIRQQFRWIYRFLWNKWWFDEIYNAIFVQPVLFVSRRVAQFDLRVIDRIINAAASVTVAVSKALDQAIDRRFIDGVVNWVAYRTWDLALDLRKVQTGRIRQYVVFIAVGTVALFVLISFVWSYAVAGPGH